MNKNLRRVFSFFPLPLKFYSKVGVGKRARKICKYTGLQNRLSEWERGGEKPGELYFYIKIPNENGNGTHGMVSILSRSLSLSLPSSSTAIILAVQQALFPMRVCVYL